MYFFFFFACTSWHAGSWFPDQGLSLHPLQWKLGESESQEKEILILF